MVSLMDLWLPIVLSSVFVFVSSTIIHMVLKLHNSDYKKLPGEDKISAAMREAGVAPGFYSTPHFADMKDMGTPEGKKRLEEGPVGFIAITPSGPPSIGKFLGMWFALSLAISLCAAYITSRALGPDADYLSVFRFAGTAAFLGYAMGEPISSIWKGQPWGMTIKHMGDGLVYALLTGGVFGWLWP